MSRVFLPLAAFLVAGAGFAFAADAPSQPVVAATSHPKIVFTMQDARKHLMHLGYTSVSELSRDASGNWVGSAVKDGKTVPVAVFVKPVQ